MQGQRRGLSGQVRQRLAEGLEVAGVILGPYTVAPQGLDYQVDITLTFGRQGAPFRPNPAPTSAHR